MKHFALDFWHESARVKINFHLLEFCLSFVFPTKTEIRYFIQISRHKFLMCWWAEYKPFNKWKELKQNSNENKPNTQTCPMSETDFLCHHNFYFVYKQHFYALLGTDGDDNERQRWCWMFLHYMLNSSFFDTFINLMKSISSYHPVRPSTPKQKKGEITVQQNETKIVKIHVFVWKENRISSLNSYFYIYGKTLTWEKWKKIKKTI